MGVHDGHRERMRERFLKHGLDNFDDISALEFLLFYAIPRRDTNEIAHALIDHFGSIDNVFSADFDELTSIPGIGENAAALIMLVPELVKKSEMASVNNVTTLKTKDQLGEYLVPRFINESDEVLYILCLDSKYELIQCVELGRGDVISVNVSIRKISEIALKYRASIIVLSHNHPRGRAIPSGEDIRYTRQIKDALRMMEIELYDHIVVAGRKYSSFREAGYLATFLL